MYLFQTRYDSDLKLDKNWDVIENILLEEVLGINGYPTNKSSSKRR